MKVFIKILSVAMFIFMFLFTVTAKANDKLEDPQYVISDCIDVGDYKKDIGEQIKESKKCIDNLSMDNDISDQNLETRKNLLSSVIGLFYTVVKYSSTLLAILLPMFVAHKLFKKLVFDDINVDISNSILSWSIASIIIAIGTNSSTSSFLVNKFTIAVDNNITTYLAMNNVVGTRSQSAKQQLINSNILQTSKLSQIVGFGIIYSEFCSERYIEDKLTVHNYESKDFILTKESECFDQYNREGEGLTFLERGGRSILNYTVKKCSSKLDSRDYDCGTIDGVSSDSEIGKLINANAVQYVELAKQFDAAQCDELNVNDLSETSLQSYCRKWNGSSFALKTTNLSTQDIEAQLIKQHNSFISELSNAVSKDMNEHIVLNTALFSNFELANGLIKSSVDEDDFENDLLNLLGEIRYNSPFVINHTMGNDLDMGSQEGSSISSKDGYFLKLFQDLNSLYSSDEMAADTTMELMKLHEDPKLMFGHYAGEGFELDAQPLRSLQDNMKTLGIMYMINWTASNSLYTVGRKTGDMALIKTAQKLKSYNNGLLYAILFSILFLPMIILLKTVQYVCHVFLKIVTFTASAVAHVFKKGDVRVIVISLLEFKLLPTIFMSLNISFMLTSFFVAIWYDTLVALGLEVIQNYNFGIQLAAPILYLLGFTVLINIVFISTYFTTSRVISSSIQFKNIPASISFNMNSEQDAVGQLRKVVGKIR